MVASQPIFMVELVLLILQLTANLIIGILNPLVVSLLFVETRPYLLELPLDLRVRRSARHTSDLEMLMVS
jgi:hypothetical protein